MNFDLTRSLEILAHTPTVLRAYLGHLSDDWLRHNEGPDTWSPYDVLGHLIHGEKTDWTTRMRIIMDQSAERTFTPFDRFAQFETDQTRPVGVLLDEFALLRADNLAFLTSQDISEADWQKTGLHPALGEVTLQQLIATWTVHDLGHLAQISRTLAKQYKEQVGPWQAYLSVLHR